MISAGSSHKHCSGLARRCLVTCWLRDTNNTREIVNNQRSQTSTVEQEKPGPNWWVGGGGSEGERQAEREKGADRERERGRQAARDALDKNRKTQRDFS